MAMSNKIVLTIMIIGVNVGIGVASKGRMPYNREQFQHHTHISLTPNTSSSRISETNISFSTQQLNLTVANAADSITNHTDSIPRGVHLSPNISTNLTQTPPTTTDKSTAKSSEEKKNSTNLVQKSGQTFKQHNNGAPVDETRLKHNSQEADNAFDAINPSPDKEAVVGNGVAEQFTSSEAGVLFTSPLTPSDSSSETAGPIKIPEQEPAHSPRDDKAGSSWEESEDPQNQLAKDIHSIEADRPRPAKPTDAGPKHHEKFIYYTYNNLIQSTPSPTPAPTPSMGTVPFNISHGGVKQVDDVEMQVPHQESLFEGDHGDRTTLGNNDGDYYEDEDDEDGGEGLLDDRANATAEESVDVSDEKQQQKPLKKYFLNDGEDVTNTKGSAYDRSWYNYDNQLSEQTAGAYEEYDYLEDDYGDDYDDYNTDDEDQEDGEIKYTSNGVVSDEEWLRNMVQGGDHASVPEAFRSPLGMDTHLGSMQQVHIEKQHMIPEAYKATSFLSENSMSLLVIYTWLAVVVVMLLVAFVVFRHRQKIVTFFVENRTAYRRKRSGTSTVSAAEEGHQLLSNPHV